jgi:hypothetical protein
MQLVDSLEFSKALLGDAYTINKKGGQRCPPFRLPSRAINT